MTMTFYVDHDSDNEGFYSVWADNGQGFGWEVCGKIGDLESALAICHRLSA